MKAPKHPRFTFFGSIIQHTFVHVYIHVHTFIHAHMQYMHVYIHTYTYVYTYISLPAISQTPFLTDSQYEK